MNAKTHISIFNGNKIKMKLSLANVKQLLFYFPMLCFSKCE